MLEINPGYQYRLWGFKENQLMCFHHIPKINFQQLIFPELKNTLPLDGLQINFKKLPIEFTKTGLSIIVPVKLQTRAKNDSQPFINYFNLIMLYIHYIYNIIY